MTSSVVNSTDDSAVNTRSEHPFAVANIYIMLNNTITSISTLMNNQIGPPCVDWFQFEGAKWQQQNLPNSPCDAVLGRKATSQTWNVLERTIVARF